MILFGQSAGSLSKPELLVGLLGVTVLSGYGIWRLTRWLLSSPTIPDPWDEQVAAELAASDCTPLCHHCLSPHLALANFCPNCGAAVGPFTNWLPYPYLFSVGHTLRIGTNENFKRSLLTVGGFLVFSCVEYGPFAPIYWFGLLRNLRRPNLPSEPDSPRPLAGKDA